MKRIFPTLVALLTAGLLASAAGAGQVDFSDAGVEVDRDPADLHDTLPPDEVDPDFLDTALVFTNGLEREARVVCVAFDKDGAIVGRGHTKIPGMGLRYILASDLSDDVDFVGSVRCGAHPRVAGSAILLAPGAVTALKGGHHRRGRIKFPVVAHR